jgi:hypothetical protein
MLYMQVNAVCSEIHTKHINTLCGQNVELMNVKLVVHIVTTGLWRVKYPFLLHRKTIRLHYKEHSTKPSSSNLGIITNTYTHSFYFSKAAPCTNSKHCHFNMVSWRWHSSAETCWTDRRLYYFVSCWWINWLSKPQPVDQRSTVREI